MSEERIKELQIFADDFKNKLKKAKERYQQNALKTMESDNEQNKIQSKSYALKNHSHKRARIRNRYVNNIYNI